MSDEFGFRAMWVEHHRRGTELVPYNVTGKQWVFPSRAVDPVNGVSARQVVDMARRHTTLMLAQLTGIDDLEVIVESRRVDTGGDGRDQRSSWSALATITLVDGQAETTWPELERNPDNAALVRQAMSTLANATEALRHE